MPTTHPATRGSAARVLPALIIAAGVVLCFSGVSSPEDESTVDLNRGLIFFASFDDVTDANLSTDDGFIQTADSLARENVVEHNRRKDVTIAKGEGRVGDALRFSAVSKQVLFYHGVNFGYREKDWSGTVSFWLKLDPDRDLEPGFCDPIQITDKKWNDAAMWVDFDKDLPRAFRLGMFPNYKTWNPKDTPFDKIPEQQLPRIPVAEPPFQSDQWTHVAWTFENVNARDGSDAMASLYLNGELQGTLKRPLQFDWDADNVAIMLGINYIGDFDELSIYNRALKGAEVNKLYSAPHEAPGHSR